MRSSHKKPKTRVSENFGPISKSEAFLMGLKVSFSGIFASRSLEFFRPRVSGFRICRFSSPLGLQESSQSSWVNTAYQTEVESLKQDK